MIFVIEHKSLDIALFWWGKFFSLLNQIEILHFLYHFDSLLAFIPYTKQLGQLAFHKEEQTKAGTIFFGPFWWYCFHRIHHIW